MVVLLNPIESNEDTKSSLMLIGLLHTAKEYIIESFSLFSS